MIKQFVFAFKKIYNLIQLSIANITKPATDNEAALYVNEDNNLTALLSNDTKIILVNGK